MLTQEAIFIATIKGTSLVIKTRPFSKNLRWTYFISGNTDAGMLLC